MDNRSPTNATIPLREAASILSGGTPSKAESAFWQGDIPWISPKDMGEDLIEDSEDRITVAAIENSSAKLAPAGSVLVVVRSSVLARKFPIGLITRSAAFNQDIKCLVVDKRRFLPEYIFWFLRSAESRVLLLGVKKGATVHSLSAGYLENLPVPVLPLDEQRRIVDILNHAASIRRLRDQARATARALLPALFVEMFGDPATNPMGWEVKPLGELISKVEGGKNVLAGDETGDTTLRILKVSAVTSGMFRPSESKPAPNNYKPPASHFIKSGDLLFSRANTEKLVGATAFVKSTTSNLLLPDKIWRFVFKDRSLIDPHYTHYFLQQPNARAEMSKMATGTSDSMKNISQQKLYTLPVLLPPLALQQEFAERVAELESVAALHERAAAAAEEMVQSLSAQFFGAA